MPGMRKGMTVAPRRRFPDASQTLPLHVAANTRMYELLTANTPGCVAFSLPVQRRNLPSRSFLRLSRSSPQPALRAADTEGRFRARAASGPRYYLARYYL